MSERVNYFSIIFSLIILYLSFLLVRPFLGALVSAIIISYIIYPFYEKINKKIKKKNLTIILMLLIVVFLFLIPSSVIVYSLIDDISGFLQYIRTLDVQRIPHIEPEIESFIENYLIKVSESFTSNLLGLLVRFGGSIPNRIINILIFLFATSLFLKKGPEIIDKLKITLPIEKEQKKSLIEEFERVTKGMIYSLFFSTIYNMVLGALVFFIFDMPNPLLWGFMMGIFSMVPIIGSRPIWIGGIIYMLLLGNYLFALILTILAVMVIELDGLIITKVFGEKSNINSFLIFIGIISGIRLFGPSGLIFGPLVLSSLITMIRFYTRGYKKEFKF